MGHQKFRSVAVILVFCGLIAFPLLNGIIGWIDDLSSAENRQLASEPTLEISHLDPYPKAYDSYYSDHFPLRFRMIDWYTKLQFLGFDSSPVPDKAIIGKNGWYFMAGNEQNSFMGDFMFSPAELETFKQELEYRQRYIAARGGQLYFVVAPAKNNIYSEEMPMSAHSISEISWGEQLTQYLAANSSVKTINVYDELRKRHQTELVYYKLDNHWNQLGAFYAANVILEAIGKDLPNVQTNDLQQYEIRQGTATTGNIVDMFGTDLAFEEITYALSPKAGFRAKVAPKVPYPPVVGFGYPDDYEQNRVIEDSSKAKLLLISDSFGHNILPFLSEQFQRTVNIFDCWQYKLNAPIVDQEKPDAVVLMILEGNLRNFFEFQSHLKPE